MTMSKPRHFTRQNQPSGKTYQRAMGWAPLALGLALASCVQPTNSWDPQTPVDEQEKASVEGAVVLVRSSFDPAIMLDDLSAMTVELFDTATDTSVRIARCSPLGATEYPLSCSGDDGTALIAFSDLTPGDYRLRITGAPPELVGAENDVDVGDLSPGESRRLGSIFLRERPVDGVVGSGSISGRVVLQGQQGAARTVTLYRRTGVGAQPVAQAPTNTDGEFEFAGLADGTYGVLAELSGFAPAIHVGLELQVTDEVANPSFRLDTGSPDGDALTLFPVTAVLQPNLSTEDNGAYYTSGDDVSVNVLAFTDASQLRMRVSTDPSFADGADAFVPYSAQVTQALPDVQGPVALYGQFQAQHPDHPQFVFTTDLFSTEVVRDTEPPEVIDVEVRNLVASEDGTLWMTQEGGAVGLDVLAVDDVSSVARAFVHIQDDNGPGDASVLGGNDVDAPLGLAQLQMTSTTTAGEGEKVFWVWLADQAGNTAEPTPVTVVVDVTPPVLGDAGNDILPLVVQNADASGVLAGRTAQLAFHVPEGVALADEPVRMRVAQDAVAAGAPFVAFDVDEVATVSGGNGSSFAFVAEVEDRAGNVATVTSPTYTLDLSGTVRGRALVDQLAADTPVHGSIVARLYTAADVVGVDAAVDETLTDATGTYIFGGVPEGSGYRVVLDRPGLVTTEIGVGQVVAGGTTSLGSTRLPYARGNATGVFRLEDKVDDLSAHGGILVTALRDGEVMAQTVTEPDGTYTFPVPGLPVTVDTQRYEVRASTESYFTGVESGIQVQQNLTTVVRETSVGSGVAEPVLLKPTSGDFVLCDVGADPCEQTPFTNADTVRVLLQSDLDVTQIRVQSRSSFEAGDADPAWVPYDSGTPVVIDISGADGVVEVFVQLWRDGAAGAVLSASILRDTVAPEPTGVFVASTQETAVGPFTNRPEARLRLTAQAGQGDVAPLGGAFFSWAPTAPASIPVDAALCAANADCVVALDGGAAALEGEHTVWGFVCDQAGNCSQTPQSDSIVYDVTEPRALHGVSFVPVGASVVESAGDYYTGIAQYFIDLGVGTAADDAAQPVTDPDGLAVADVGAFRFLPVFVGQASPPTGVDLSQVPFTDATLGVTAGGTLDNIVAPGLAGNDGLYRVFAQFRDHAGNVSAADNNPFFFDITLDTSPPSVTLAANGGAPYTTSTNLTLDISASPTDAPVSVWLANDGGLFEDHVDVALSNPPQSVMFDLAGTADYVGDGLYFVYARFFDAAGNSVDRSDSITVDTTPPQTTPLVCSTCVSSSGSVLSASRDVTLELFATDALSGVQTLRTSVSGGPVVETDFALSTNVTLPDADGPCILSVAFVDGAGNASPAEQLVVTLDRTPPTLSSFTINGGDATTTSATVTLGVSASDATGVRFSNTATFNNAFVPFAPSAVWNLASPSVDESKQVYVEVQDAAGNVSASSASIVLDTTPPAGTVTIAAGVAATSSATANVALAFPDDTAAYGLFNGSVDCTTVSLATSVTVGATSANTMHTLLAGDGTKTVSACFRDVAGNVALAADTIELDTTAPSGTVVVDGGAPFSSDAVVDVQLSASDDVTEVLLTETAPDCATAGGYQPYEPNKTYTLTGVDGDITVYACLRDHVGLTYLMSDSIALDRVAPTVSLTLDGGASTTADANVTLGLTSSSDVVDLAVANAGSLDCATAAYGPYTATQNWTLAAPDGSKSVSVCVRDGAGLVGSATAAITLDTSPPVGSVVLAAGSATTQTASVAVVLNHPNDTNGYALANDGIDCATASFTTVTVGGTMTSTTTTLASGDGLKTVAVCFRDVAGNTATAFDGITLDTTDPVGSVVINSGDLATNDADITVALTASADVTEVALRQGAAIDCGAVTYEAMEASKLFSLTGGDGPKALHACFRDESGRTSSSADGIVLDTTPPLISRLEINQAATHTTDLAAVVGVDADDPGVGLASMRIANDSCGNITGPEWAFTASVPWTLSTGADGTRTVCVEVKDYAGNTTTQTDTITVDRGAPTGSVAINGGATYATSTTVTASGTAGEAVEFAVGAESVDCTAATYSGMFSTSVSVPFADLLDEDGTRTLALCLRDRAGNTSQISDTIILDRERPFGLFTVDDNALYTQDRDVDIDLTDRADDTVEMFFDSTVTNCDLLLPTDWDPVADTAALTLPSTDGVQEVHGCLRDAAGNTSPMGPEYITLDQAAPPAATLRYAVGSATSASTNASSPRVDNGDTTNDPRPRFFFSQGADATSGIEALYLQLSTSSGFAVVDYESDPYPSDGMLPPADLAQGTWYWRVRTVDRAGHETVSSSESFTVDTTPPEAPLLTANDGAFNSNVFYQWEDGGGGTVRYGFQLLDSAGGIVFQGQTASTSYNLLVNTHIPSPSANAGTGYSFRVRAVDVLDQTSAWVADAFIFDNVAPCETTADIVINGGVPTHTNENDVVADLECVGDTPTRMQLNCNGSSATSMPVTPFQRTVNCNLDINSQGYKYVSARVIDDAGNVRNLGWDRIIFDNIAPTPPVVAPTNAVGVNSSCAKLDVPTGTTLDTNFSTYQIRNNGGTWQNTVPVSGKVQFSLSQDVDNLLEVRAVDQAGNVGESSVAIIGEKSSTVIPTNLTVKHICDNGAFAILKDTRAWPVAYGATALQTSRPDEVQPVVYPDIYLLDLNTLEYRQFNGNGGMASLVAWAETPYTPPAYENTLDAACSFDDDRVVFSYIEPLDPADAFFEGDGTVHTVVWRDPLNNPYSNADSPVGPWTWSPGGATGYAVNSIDVVRFTSSTDPYWEGLVTTNWQLAIPGEALNRVRVTSGGMEVFDGGSQAYITGGLSGLIGSRVVYGLAFYGTDSAYLRRDNDNNQWEVARTDGYTDPGTEMAGLVWPDSGGFSKAVSPYGSHVKQDLFRSAHASYQPYAQFVASRADGRVYAHLAFSTSSYSVAPTASYAYATFYQRGRDLVSWMHETETNIFELTDTYQSDPDVLSATTRQDYRTLGHTRKPVLSTGSTLPDTPVVLYHTSPDAESQGVVIGYQDDAVCFNN